MARAFDEGMNSSSKRPASGVNRTIERMWSIDGYRTVPHVNTTTGKGDRRIFCGSRRPGAAPSCKCGTDASVCQPDDLPQRLLNRLGDIGRFRRHLGLETGHHLTVLVHQELGEIPLDLAARGRGEELI